MARNIVTQKEPVVNRLDANRILRDWQNSDFDNLHDDRLLEATRWTGRPGYPIRVMWRTHIASHVLNSGTFTGLIRELALECVACVVGELGRALPGLGEIVAIDSTDIHAYSNGSRKRSSNPDASWSAKRGKNGKPRFWYGFKGHLMSDAPYEITSWIHTTTAKRNDGHEILPLLQEARDRLPGFRPEYVLSDAGYDHKKVYREIIEDSQIFSFIIASQCLLYSRWLLAW